MSASPYEALARAAERELELARAGDLVALEELQATAAALVARLPERPPAAARAALERAAELQRRASDALAAQLESTRTELGRLDRGRRAARSYGGPSPAAARAVDHAA